MFGICYCQVKETRDGDGHWWRQVMLELETFGDCCRILRSRMTTCDFVSGWEWMELMGVDELGWITVAAVEARETAFWKKMVLALMMTNVTPPTSDLDAEGVTMDPMAIVAVNNVPNFCFPPPSPPAAEPTTTNS